MFLTIYIVLLKDWDRFLEYRKTIKALSENCIRKEMKLCRKENVEQHIWKILYYNLIEFLKVLISDSKLDQQSEYFQVKLFEIIEDGLAFYNYMLDVLQSTYNFKLSDLLETDVEYRGMDKDPIISIKCKIFSFQLKSKTINLFNWHWCQRKNIFYFWAIYLGTRTQIKLTII